MKKTTGMVAMVALALAGCEGTNATMTPEMAAAVEADEAEKTMAWSTIFVILTLLLTLNSGSSGGNTTPSSGTTPPGFL